MSAMNSGVLACNYVLSGASESSRKLVSMSSSASPVAAQPRVLSVRAQQVQSYEPQEKRSEGRRAALLGLAGVLFTTAATASPANAGVIDEYLEKSKANKVPCCSCSSCVFQSEQKTTKITTRYEFLQLSKLQFLVNYILIQKADPATLKNA